MAQYGLREACDNTLLIAERCDVSFTEGRQPHAALPRARRARPRTSWFVKEVERGLQLRYPGGVPDEVRKQAEYEIDVITQMGFPGYFLVVADFINWAKEQRHPGRPRSWLGGGLDRGVRDAASPTSTRSSTA